jgi:hypothetical protein
LEDVAVFRQEASERHAGKIGILHWPDVTGMAIGHFDIGRCAVNVPSWRKRRKIKMRIKITKRIKSKIRSRSKTGIASLFASFSYS